MRIKCFTDSGWEDYLWIQKNSKPDLKRLNKLINIIARTPFDGIGKPEPLHGEMNGYWSRRVNDRDRIVYTVTESEIIIIACRTHYGQR
ncbi:Txe/YoeB family addiction module toxin [Lactobacillus sp. Sy-1]|uniref:Txe/YoeB family addiction module toxin n=1 Tax=Lactobacillus sp. Sy-1 TaxID=2109645 RepID=UPI00210338B0|nr:Txe/YoeB family addiction module toxin [Lactobacillus sp. Sy-1]MBW1606323.1 Txe/YoeB family addiction module toxin [Lactobacillus sp. Sy-1]